MPDLIYPSDAYKDITQHEIKAMKAEYNLADAHTRQSQSPTQREIVERLPELWYESEKTNQHEMEERFIHAFFHSQRQTTALTTPTMLVYASSIAMVMIANFLALKKMSVSLLEPCFDNIYDILHNMDISIDKPLNEEWLHDPDAIYQNLTENVNADAVFIVEPNNPTGFTLEGTTQTVNERKNSYLELIRYAKDHSKLLIFDFCFSSFLLEDAESASFDVYKELDQSGVSYIIVEDTGKTWPLQDTKVAMLKSSKDLHSYLHNIHTSYLLNVSPFILNLVTQYVEDSEKDNFASVFELLKQNRDTAKIALDGSLLELQDSMANVSVAWLKMKSQLLKASDLQILIQQQGVYILPGTNFFWSDHAKGEGFMRIALARDTSMFNEAIGKLRTILDEIESNLIEAARE